MIVLVTCDLSPHHARYPLEDLRLYDCLYPSPARFAPVETEGGIDLGDLLFIRHFLCTHQCDSSPFRAIFFLFLPPPFASSSSSSSPTSLLSSFLRARRDVFGVSDLLHHLEATSSTSALSPESPSFLWICDLNEGLIDFLM